MTSQQIRLESMIAASGTSGTGGNIPFGTSGFRGFNPFGASNLNENSYLFLETDELGK